MNILVKYFKGSPQKTIFTYQYVKRLNSSFIIKLQVLSFSTLFLYKKSPKKHSQIYLI